MTYRATKKRRKIWSIQANQKQERLRQEREPYRQPHVDLDPHMTIEVKRKQTGEHALFECFEGDRIDNYSVYCNGQYQGIQSITTLMKNIGKALPAFRREE